MSRDANSQELTRFSEKNMELFLGNLESFTAFLELFPILSSLRNCDVRYCHFICCKKKKVGMVPSVLPVRPFELFENFTEDHA